MDQETLKVATHSGKFHSDDVTAAAILSLAFPGFSLDDIIRTRDSEILSQADIVFDVGGIHDPENWRFDYHMANPPMRNDTLPYSSAGMIWEAFGERTIRSIASDMTQTHIDLIWIRIDQELIIPIDLVDNGRSQPCSTDYSVIIARMNPQWDTAEGSEKAAFIGAATFARNTLIDQIQDIASTIRAQKIDKKAIRDSKEIPEILVLPRAVPWQDTVFSLSVPALFVIHPNDQGMWQVTSVPIAPDSFITKVPLRSDWAGLTGESLQEASGVSDAVFVHRNLFTGAAWSFESARQMALLSMEHHRKFAT